LLIAVQCNLAAFSTKASFSSKNKNKSNENLSNAANAQVEDQQIKLTPVQQHLEHARKNDIPDAPDYYQGWVKFFNYSLLNHDKKDMPKKFFKNDSFETQVVKEGKDEVRLF
jgi:hypothetical protein